VIPWILQWASHHLGHPLLAGSRTRASQSFYRVSGCADTGTGVKLPGARM
jgi:hypothetical protein